MENLWKIIVAGVLIYALVAGLMVAGVFALLGFGFWGCAMAWLAGFTATAFFLSGRISAML